MSLVDTYFTVSDSHGKALAIPDECICLILSFCDEEDVTHFRRVCRAAAFIVQWLLAEIKTLREMVASVGQHDVRTFIASYLSGHASGASVVMRKWALQRCHDERPFRICSITPLNQGQTLQIVASCALCSHLQQEIGQEVPEKIGVYLFDSKGTVFLSCNVTLVTVTLRVRGQQIKRLCSRCVTTEESASIEDEVRMQQLCQHLCHLLAFERHQQPSQQLLCNSPSAVAEPVA